jgi:hypothetical protein
MDPTTMVGLDVAGGAKLIEALDTSKLSVHSAFWFYLDEAQKWRLIIASPYVDQYGPTASYTLIQDVLEKIEPPLQIQLSDITVVSPHDDLIRLLSSAISTGPGIAGIRFSKNVINNVFIEDAYIYRLQHGAPV